MIAGHESSRLLSLQAQLFVESTVWYPARYPLSDKLHDRRHLDELSVNIHLKYNCVVMALFLIYSVGILSVKRSQYRRGARSAFVHV